MEKIRAKLIPVKVSYGTSSKGRSYSVIEGLSPDIGLFRVFASKELGTAAEEYLSYADGCYGLFEIFGDARNNYSVSARLVGIERV